MVAPELSACLHLVRPQRQIVQPPESIHVILGGAGLLFLDDVLVRRGHLGLLVGDRHGRLVPVGVCLDHLGGGCAEFSRRVLLKNVVITRVPHAEVGFARSARLRLSYGGSCVGGALIRPNVWSSGSSLSTAREIEDSSKKAPFISLQVLDSVLGMKEYNNRCNPYR